MLKFKFEYRITLIYLVIGGLWILFSDRLLESFLSDVNKVTQIQTYKGWFYVSVTGILLFLLVKKHLTKLRQAENEVQRHRHNLEELVNEKTRNLEEALRNLKETQTQLLQSEKMASLGVLTAGVAHEINNPLNYILGGVTALEDELLEKKITNDNINLYIESIKTGVEKASGIVVGLNQFSRDRDSFEEVCDINEILINALVVLNSQLKENVEILKDFSSADTKVEGNVGKLHQVFVNVIANANHSIENKGDISIATQVKNDKVSITIADTGCGIAKEDLSRITDPFFTTKAPGEGTGLGLAIVYKIIEDHKGKLLFNSEPNKGTAVTIELPRKHE